jgi:uncharacterized protein
MPESSAHAQQPPSLHLARLLRDGSEASGRGELTAFAAAELVVVAPATWRASAVQIGDHDGNESGLWLSGEVTAALQLSCSRCLDPVETNVRARFEAMLRYEARVAEPRLEIEEDGEVIVFGNPEFDLSALLTEAVLAEMPLKLLCKNDCQGLCTHCGVNLNRHDRSTCAEGLSATNCPVLGSTNTKPSPFSALKDLL